MELHAPDRPTLDTQALDRLVVERFVGDDDVGLALGSLDCEAVVLARHEHAARLGLEHRMVRAAMAEAQLVRVETDCSGQQLMAETDAKDGHTKLEHRLDIGDMRVHRARIAGSVGEQDAVWVERADLVCRRIVRDDHDMGTGLGDEIANRILCAVIEQHHRAARRATGRVLLALWTRDTSGEILARHRGRVGDQLLGLLGRGAIGDERRAHRTLVAQVLDERPRVDAKQDRHAVLRQPVEQSRAACGCGVARLAADHADRLHTIRLADIALDAVVADHRRRERDHLAAKRRVRQRLLIPRHASRKDGFAKRNRGRASTLAVEPRAVF